MSTAPWWATGAFTLAGVLLAQFAAFALNRSRDRFEDSRRWHEDRRDIYLAVVVNAWKIQDAVYGRFEEDRPLPDDLATVLTELNTARTKVQLVGSEEVSDVTDRLRIEGSAALTSSHRGDQAPSARTRTRRSLLCSRSPYATTPLRFATYRLESR